MDFFTNCLLFGALKFVVTANWLPLNVFTVQEPCGYNKVILLYRKPKVVNITTTFNLILSVLNNFFVRSKTLPFNKYYSNIFATGLSLVHSACTAYTYRQHYIKLEFYFVLT